MRLFGVIGSWLMVSAVLAFSAHAEAPQASAPKAIQNGAVAAPGAVPGVPGVAPAAPIKPYRAFVTIQSYTMENNGEPNSPISNVRIEISFMNVAKMALPDGGQFWPINNGQMQPINRTYELPWEMIQNDGFKFSIQMYRKGSQMLPCEFDVTQLSQFNRGYVCHTDINWQTAQNLPEDKIDREGIQLRIFTDLNSEKKDVPTDAQMLRPTPELARK